MGIPVLSARAELDQLVELESLIETIKNKQTGERKKKTMREEV